MMNADPLALAALAAIAAAIIAGAIAMHRRELARGMRPEPPLAEIVPLRCCRACGCHDWSACYGELTGPCWWVEPDLCSACAGLQPDAEREFNMREFLQ